MKIVNYKLILPTKVDNDKKAIYIEDTLESRNQFMSEFNFKNRKELLEDIKPTGKTAVLYIGGASEHHSHNRTFQNLSLKGIMPIQNQMGYMASKIAKFYNAEFLSINSNACASSMYALYEAKQLLNNGFDDVIIYGEEWVDDVELFMFKQMGIDIFCADAFCILHLQKGEQIGDINFIYHPEKHPFEVSIEGYLKSMNPFKDMKFDAIKTHGTGTINNDITEDEAIEFLFNDTSKLKFKKIIGHTQGCSTMVEICQLLEYGFKGNYLINASGLGNFYGSCTIKIN